MGRYLDLLRGRGDQTSEEIRECDISDRSDQSPLRPPLRSLLSLLSRSWTCGFDGELDVPAEFELQASRPSPDDTTNTTETTKVDLGATSESPTPDCYTLTEGPIISPVRWAAPPTMATGGPSFEEPCPERRGLVERRGAVFLHFCIECGRWGAYGYGASLGQDGRWYCRLHRPDEER
jgi:hypothetical protein